MVDTLSIALYSTASFSKSNRTRGRKRVQIERYAVRYFLFAVGMILCLYDSRDSIRKVCDLMNLSVNAEGYGINTKKNL